MRSRYLAAVLAISLVGAGVAHAHGSSGGAQLPPDAEPVTAEGTKAKEILDALPSDAASKALFGKAAEKARMAMGRAHGAHLAKDSQGARMLSRVALAWAQAASASMRAADAEKRAAESETKAKDLKEKIDRARALLAEAEARKLQLAAEVAKAEEAARKGPAPKTEPDKKKPKDKDKPKADDKKKEPEKAKADPPKTPPKKAPEQAPKKAGSK